ncbi:hypothetical protein LTR82_017739 [Friedmanniomyces endolithicus]|uniref:Uncharacterized protein n=1 Tax=Friedmanniomyces endolithicus TaxID=329885 RepID=A0AAN6IZG2_9PEZI|nr:hypothetical protein LTR82_017739 [Friedmanniomyces endolithicus]
MATQCVARDRSEIQWEAAEVHGLRNIAGAKQWLIEWCPTNVTPPEFDQMCVDTIESEPMATMMDDTMEMVVDGRIVVRVFWKQSWVNSNQAGSMTALIKLWWMWYGHDCANGEIRSERGLTIVAGNTVKWTTTVVEEIEIDGVSTRWTT